MLNWLLKQANVGEVFLEHRGELTYHVQYPLALLVGLPLVLGLRRLVREDERNIVAAQA